MKKLISFLIFLLLASPAWATVYYVDCNADGDAGAGTSTAANVAWKTINKVNTSTFSGDDQILFNKGCTWREQLTVPSSGSAGSPITFGAYGTGAKPIISGADILTGWSSSATTIEYVVNGTMEADANWSNDGTPTVNERSSTQAHGGTYSRKFTVDIQYEGITSAAGFTTTNGVTYTYSAWVYPDSTSMMFGILKGNGSFYAVQTWISTMTPGAWNHISGTYVEDGQGANAKVRFRSYTGQINNTFYVDDVSITSPGVASDAYQKSGVTTEPKAVYYNGTKLTPHDGVTTSVGSNEWDWASDVLYVNVGTDPDNGVLEASQRNYGIVLNKSYVTIDGLEITKPQNSCISSGSTASADHNIIQNNTLTYAPNFGWKAGIVLNHASNNTIANNTVSNCYVGILLSSYHASESYPTDANTISRNTISNIDSTGISISSGSATSYQLKDNIVEYNDVSLCSQTYDDTGGIVTSRAGTGNIIRYNKSYNNGLDPTTMRGTGIMVDENSDGELVYYNICYGNTSSGIGTSGDSTLIYNNTLYNNTQGIYLFYSGITHDSSANSLIKNNICLANGDQSYAKVRSEAVASGGNVFDYNVYYGSSKSKPFSWDSGGPPADDHNWTEWQVHNAEAHSVVADPLFVSAAGLNFRLTSASPAIDAGVGVSLTSDYSGAKVPQRTNPSIGAYEYIRKIIGHRIMPGISGSATPDTQYALLETGDKHLLESGDKLLREN